MDIAVRSIIMILIPGFLYFQDIQETISGIKADCAEISGKMINSIYKQDKSQLEDFISILNLDVFGYYNLKNQYNTDTRRKLYTETEDYKTQYSKLNELRNQLLSSTYYLDFEPDYLAERSIGLIYNQDTQSFSVSNDVSLSIFFDELGFIQLDQILFKCPPGMTVSGKNVSYSCLDVIEETISFRINDNNLVSKIRGNRDYLKLLFVFNIKDLIITKGKKNNLTSSDYSIMTDLQKVIAYNSRTEEIYSVYE